MTLSWITLYPQWYVDERRLLAERYPQFTAAERLLKAGKLWLFGELQVRVRGGTRRHPVMLMYPAGTPYEKPVVVPLQRLPEFNEQGETSSDLTPEFFDRRHQMPDGALCLFQRETRAHPGGDIVRGVDVLKRAEAWFIGYHTGHWPPDSVESELEAHFTPRGDLLISDIFYREDLTGWGRFFFTPDGRRADDTGGLGLLPLIVTALTEEGGSVARVLDARGDLSRAYPWLRDEAWDPNALLDDPPDDPRHGFWWSLPAEPQPFRDGAGLLDALSPAVPNGDAWAAISTALATELTTNRLHFIGLRFPARQGGVEWLVVAIVRGDRRVDSGYVIQAEADKRAAFEAAPVVGIRVHSLRPTALQLRNTGVVSGSVVQQTVALIGLGALGSEVAELLAKAGVGKFRLCDSDRLVPGNVTRHVGGVADFGAPKTHVIARRLLEINPFLTFEPSDLLTGSADADLDDLRDFIAPADLVIVTTADEGVEGVINQVAVLQHKSVLYGRALRRASMGRVFLVRPGLDACKSCLAMYAWDDREGRSTSEDWVDVPEAEDDVLLHECGRPVIAGSGVDLSFTAALTARIALDALEGTIGDTNHWLWSRSAVPDVDSRLASGMTTLTGRLDPRSDCAICAEPRITQLVISEEVRAAMIATTEASVEAETGGILIGYVDEGRRAIVVEATGPGPGAEQSRTIFRRDVEYVQAELDRASAALGERGGYLGEWHSHLQANPRPSPTDITSLMGIAGAPHYLTDCPVMVIAGLELATGRVANLNAWSFPIGRRMSSIEIVAERASASV